VAARKWPSVGQLGKLRSDCQSDRAAVGNRRAGCHPAPHAINIIDSPLSVHARPADQPHECDNITDEALHWRLLAANGCVVMSRAGGFRSARPERHRFRIGPGQRGGRREVRRGPVLALARWLALQRSRPCKGISVRGPETKRRCAVSLEGELWRILLGVPVREQVERRHGRLVPVQEERLMAVFRIADVVRWPFSAG